MAVRILHISDLHVGSREEPDLAEPLGELIERVRPELVVASGDLTHRGRPAQHERAAALLAGLGPPVLAVPGNHDIPVTIPGRFTRSFVEFERRFGTAEPVFSSPTLHAVGLNSARPWRHQSGGLPRDRLERASERLAAAPGGALRVAVLHHHLIGAPWRTRKRPVARRGDVLATLAGAGAELILGGHTHQAAVSERREFEVDGGPAVVVAVAPGLGRPRPRRRGEARGLLLAEADGKAIAISTYLWADGGFALAAVRRFGRGRPPLSAEDAARPGP